MSPVNMYFITWSTSYRCL